MRSGNLGAHVFPKTTFTVGNDDFTRPCGERRAQLATLFAIGRHNTRPQHMLRRSVRQSPAAGEVPLTTYVEANVFWERHRQVKNCGSSLIRDRMNADSLRIGRSANVERSVPGAHRWFGFRESLSRLRIHQPQRDALGCQAGSPKNYYLENQTSHESLCTSHRQTIFVSA